MLVHKTMYSFNPSRMLVMTAVAAGLAAAGCGQKEDSAPVRGTAALQLSRSRIALGSPVDVTYRFTVGPDGGSLGTRKVFVHFVDANGEQMWTDDHDPPTPTTNWTAGQTVEYTRTVFAPVYPYIGQAKVLIGLYDPTSGDRVRFSGTDIGGRAYDVAQFELLPQTENVFLIFKDGWHSAESAADNAMVEWQWTKKEATLAFRNPRRDSILYFQADNPGRSATAATQVDIRIGEQVLQTVPVGPSEGAVLKIPLPAAAMGDGDMVEIKVVANQTFVPALEAGTQSKDPRELGARVFHAFVQPQGS